MSSQEDCNRPLPSRDRRRHRSLQQPKRPVRKYDTYGFPLTLQGLVGEVAVPQAQDDQMSDSIPDQLIGLHLHWRHHLRRGHHLRRRVVDLPELVVGKRPRVPSITVHLSLFLFVRTSRTIDTVTIPDTYKCFHDIITSGAWLADDISEVVILIIFMTYISLFMQ
ncbi:uncharacterized protein LOC111382677 isoform X2 [Olea europaea var. sylvestris]|uniref:uncharacterized protein LOC111382677 isoform X2 n=1 Tax=Olea europaea var. sylvestris TaxID=158386 RepID=UPI000C1D8091|nr:uncharacterized protein LOC111382677 isoform X2 [Olea europaea var. sylvestris]